MPFVEGGESLPKENSPLAEDCEPLTEDSESFPELRESPIKNSESLANVRENSTLVLGN
ncbi:MAG: hypothetical protein LBJ67_05240 [Planctomycetaceae bacterium]|jgi:hypothetical protein|nr:hypothetical protein [Planctomycetaceae bacterium]